MGDVEQREMEVEKRESEVENRDLEVFECGRKVEKRESGAEEREQEMSERETSTISLWPMLLQTRNRPMHPSGLGVFTHSISRETSSSRNILILTTG